MSSPPLFVNCCHCRYCQRESGTAFAINAIIEADRVQPIFDTEPTITTTPSESGQGQKIARCPDCSVAVWSIYASAPGMLCVRVGTLDDPHSLTPGMHLCTKSKVPWVVLPEDVPAVEGLYDPEQYWPEESLRRRALVLSSISK